MTMAKIQPAQTKLFYSGTVSSLNNKYIDLAQSLSFVNRRKMDQGKMYFLESVKVSFNQYAVDSVLGVTLSTIPDTWVTRNAWVKAHALWKEMQDKVLEDNPSVEGTWNQLLVFMDAAHFSGGSTDAGPTLNVLPIDSGGNLISTGEWNMSTFVRPQHEVNAATGLPLAADEFVGHMMGANVGSLAPGSTLNSAGIIQGYEDTRALVVPGPDVPAEMSDSWMTLLTDDGSQEPELAEVIEGENDNPPYDRTDYIGGDANWSLPAIALTSVTTVYSPEDLLSGFAVPLGLIKISATETNKAGTDPVNPAFVLELTIAKGHYKGVACTEMRQ